MEVLREQAQSAARERAQKEHELTYAIEGLKLAGQQEQRRIAEAEERVVQHEDECRRLHVESQQRAERVQWLNEEIEGLRRSEAEQRKLIEATEARLLAQLEAKHIAETEAQKKARQILDDQDAAKASLELFRAEEAIQQERLSALNERLAELQQAHNGMTAQVNELTSSESQLKAAIGELTANEQRVRASITDAEERLRAAEQAHLAATIEAELRLEHEAQRIAEVTTLRSDFSVNARRRAEHIQSLEAEIENLRNQEAEQTKQLGEI